MSSQPRQTTEHIVVCDLCGNHIDIYSGKDRCALNWGTTPLRREEVPTPKHFLFFRRRHGDRGSGAPSGDRRSWQWDFHGECLVAALNPLVIEEARH